MQDRDLSNEELEQLNALDNQVHAAPDSGECDQSALYVEQDQDLSAADDEWEEGRYPFEITDLKLKKSKKAPNFFKYLELTLTCIAGQKKDRKMFDRVMIEGEKPTALARLVVLGKATDMYDLDSKKFFGRYIDLVGKVLWGEVVKSKDTYKGESRDRTGIGFRGYYHFSKFVLPEEGDLFAAEGDALEALDAVPALPLEQTQDFVVDGGTEVVVEEIGGYDETLETLPADEPAEEFVEEVVEEAPAPAPAPRPAPRPVANAPAAQRPAAAATKAPQAGSKPPF
jgi:hypothetical protein